MSANEARPWAELLLNEGADDRNVAAGLARFLRRCRAAGEPAAGLDLTTAYFNPQGFARVADELEALPRVRLLLGVEPPPPARELRPLGGGREQLLRRALEGHLRSLEADRDLLGFELAADAAAQRLLAWLDSGRVEVRRYERGFLHGKAFLLRDAGGLVAGSANLTLAGLTQNEELDLALADEGLAAAAGEWFERLWAEAEPFDLAALYRARYEPHPPYLIYLRMLYERYAGEVEEEAAASGGVVHLTSFQQDGVLRAARILSRYHGVLIADGVGLGKTFIAGALIEEAVRRRRQRVLLVSPAALRDGPWQAFLKRTQLGVESVSYEELSQDPQVNPEGSGGCLRFGKDEYALVVVDEAQAYRNPDTLRAQVLRRLLAGSPPKDLVLLTATPVNNSLWDLYYLLTYFIRNDASFAHAGIRSLKAHFEEAVALDPDDLSPRHLFDVLDEVAVRRTRQFVKRYYPNETVRLGEEEVPITFPEPVVRKASYDLEEALPGFFPRLAHALDCSEGECRCQDPGLAREPVLTLARYVPSRYARGARPEAHELQLAGLLRSALLKRFESSAHAFAATCRRMADSHDAFLELLEQGWVVTGEALAAWQASDSDEFDPAAVEEGEREPATAYDVAALARDVAHDRELLLAFAREAERLSAEEDPKLACLAGVLAGIVRQAQKDRHTPGAERDARKTIVFSYFADTARWVYEHLDDLIARHPELAPYRGRVALVTGEERDHADVLFGFAPRSTEAPPGRDEDRYDVLVTTDVLAEGVNLQQARNIVNYDLPWNPMRLVQRHGRIDRIGSPHERVFLHCVFPDRQLDELLGLEERLQRKIAQAAASVGLEGEVLPGSRTEEVVFAETRAEIRRLLAERADLFERGGELADAYSGEIFRQELRRALEPGSPWAELVRRLPWGSGSGLARVGAEPGYVFCARVGDHPQPQFRFVAYGGDGEPRVESETLACLAQAACEEETLRVLVEESHRRAYEAWALARRDIVAQWCAAGDPRALQPRVPKPLREAAELLRRHPPAESTVEEVDRLVDALEAPWPARIQRLVRETLRAHEGDPATAARRLAALVAELGLEPPAAAEPLPPVSEEDVHLVCWLALVPADEGAAAGPA